MAYTHCQTCERYFFHPDGTAAPPFCSPRCEDAHERAHRRRIPWGLLMFLAILLGAVAIAVAPVSVATALLDHAPPLRQRASAWLARLGPAGLDALAERIDTPDPDISLRALEGLAAAHDREAARAVVARIRKTLERLLASGGDETRIQVLRVIGRGGSSADYDYLLGALERPGLRAGAILGLGELGDDRARPVVVAQLARPVSAEHPLAVRVAAAIALVGLPGPERESLDALSQVLAEPHPPLELAAVAAIERLALDYADLSGRLIKATTHAQKAPLRRTLGHMDVALGAIRRAARTKPDPAVASRYAQVYSRITGDSLPAPAGE